MATVQVPAEAEGAMVCVGADPARSEFAISVKGET